MMTRPWKEIDQFYSELPVGVPYFDAMRNLVAQIFRSQYAQGIHAWTSMHDLCIVQTEVEYPYRGPFLRMSPQQDGTIEFRYIDTCVKSRQWVRIVPATEAFDQLCRFLWELHWFN